MATTGTITQVIGSTFDAQFPEDQLPEIFNAYDRRGLTNDALCPECGSKP